MLLNTQCHPLPHPRERLILEAVHTSALPTPTHNPPRARRRAPVGPLPRCARWLTARRARRPYGAAACGGGPPRPAPLHGRRPRCVPLRGGEPTRAPVREGVGGLSAVGCGAAMSRQESAAD
eukprot:365959-Chlamydomonas_euryale.AAC.3